ncbi:hypothetical protein F441_05579 [Phytophthora nicotianae CJ01A1]|uniref:Uncharacterized protein n=2 Tax=Phytophthora nicotianae TaxID=4792 RepID=W2XD29_PHYNI|nr:hypothetical protein L916_17157 [Phytophthora nicotianae]ETP20765.1 hypothetical protein F441_05579 [Phytophthora nicotianae CJ01A1]
MVKDPGVDVYVPDMYPIRSLPGGRNWKQNKVGHLWRYF